MSSISPAKPLTTRSVWAPPLAVPFYLSPDSVLSEAGFEAAHRGNEVAFRRYLANPRRGSLALTRDAVAELQPDAAKFLPANNPQSRIAYQGIAIRHVEERLAASPPDGSVYFVTLCRDRYTLPLAHGEKVNLKSLQAWARQVLQGLDFVGVVEAALYTNVRVLGHDFQRAVSWHVHAIVWNIPETELQARIDQVNRTCESGVPFIRPAHFNRNTPQAALGKLRYALKMPLKESRIWPRKKEMIDLETGEITAPQTGRFTQRKRDLADRPGELIRVLRVMVGMTIDKLTFAGGAGKPIFASINREALAKFRAEEALSRLSRERIKSRR